MTSAKIRLLNRIEPRDCFGDSITNLAAGKKDSLERKTRDMLDKNLVFDQDYGKVSYHPSFPSPQECL